MEVVLKDCADRSYMPPCAGAWKVPNISDWLFRVDMSCVIVLFRNAMGDVLGDVVCMRVGILDRKLIGKLEAVEGNEETLFLRGDRGEYSMEDGIAWEWEFGRVVVVV